MAFVDENKYLSRIDCSFLREKPWRRLKYLRFVCSVGNISPVRRRRRESERTVAAALPSDGLRRTRRRVSRSKKNNKDNNNRHGEGRKHDDVCALRVCACGIISRVDGCVRVCGGLETVRGRRVCLRLATAAIIV